MPNSHGKKCMLKGQVTVAMPDNTNRNFSDETQIGQVVGHNTGDAPPGSQKYKRGQAAVTNEIDKQVRKAWAANIKAMANPPNPAPSAPNVDALIQWSNFTRK